MADRLKGTEGQCLPCEIKVLFKRFRTRWCPFSRFGSVFLSSGFIYSVLSRNGLYSQAVICYSCVFLPFFTLCERKRMKKNTKTKVTFTWKNYFFSDKGTEPLNSSKIFLAFLRKGHGKVISMTFKKKVISLSHPLLICHVFHFSCHKRTLFWWCNTVLGDSNWERKSYSLKWGG